MPPLRGSVFYLPKLIKDTRLTVVFPIPYTLFLTPLLLIRYSGFHLPFFVDAMGSSVNNRPSLTGLW